MKQITSVSQLTRIGGGSALIPSHELPQDRFRPSITIYRTAELTPFVPIVLRG